MDSGKQSELEEKYYQLVIGHRQMINNYQEKLNLPLLDDERIDVTNKMIQSKAELTHYEKELEKHEILLRENPDRFVIFPIHFDEVWAYYKLQLASLWTAEEITLADDIAQWRQGPKVNLSDNDKFFIKHVLAFFAASDGIVNENLAARFYKEIQIPEARCFYGLQIAMENIHGEVYSLLIDTLVENSEEKAKLLKAVENYPSIKKLSDWAIKWMHSGAPFNQRLIAFACMEGILFSGPFCAIFWLKKRGLLPGLTFSNELISKDEGLHMDFACLLNGMLKYPATEQTITEIVAEAVEIEKEFIMESLPCGLIGMNAAEMSKYIEFVADRLLVKLGCKKNWNTCNPFTWMILISTRPKTNFFEKRVGEYNKAKFNQSKINPKLQPIKSSIEILEEF